jgi:hypothetical protein
LHTRLTGRRLERLCSQSLLGVPRPSPTVPPADPAISRDRRMAATSQPHRGKGLHPAMTGIQHVITNTKWNSSWSAHQPDRQRIAFASTTSRNCVDLQSAAITTVD